MTPRGDGASVNAPQVIAKECAERFNPGSDEQPGRISMHLLSLCRRFSLQPLDRVEDPVLGRRPRHAAKAYAAKLLPSVGRIHAVEV